MFATLALTLLAPMAGAVDTPFEPIDASVVELFLVTEGGESSCDAYNAAAQVAILAGAPEHVTMMHDMTEAYLVVEFETIWSEDGTTQRMTDDARDALHDFLVDC